MVSDNRQAMIDTIVQHAAKYQKKPLSDALLDIMRRVDRTDFGGTEEDSARPIGHGQTISQPFMVAIMTDIVLKHASQRESVVEIGAGSGYQAAILSNFFSHVTGIERLKPLAEAAQVRLDRLGYHQINIQHDSGDLAVIGPCDVVMVTCGITGDIPKNWSNGLRDQGILLAPYAEQADGDMQLMLWRKAKTGLLPINALDQPLYCQFVPFVRAE